MLACTSIQQAVLTIKGSYYTYTCIFNDADITITVGGVQRVYIYTYIYISLTTDFIKSATVAIYILKFDLL